MPKSCAADPPDAGPDAAATCGSSLPCSSGPDAGSPCPPPDKWLADMLKVMCPKDAAHLEAMRKKGVTLTAYDRIYFDDPYYDGKKWTTKRFEAGGTTSGKDINLVLTKDPNANAATLYHEGVHTLQPPGMAWRDQEYEAYTKGEQWAIDHGMSESHKGFRTVDASGKPVPDVAAIKKFVDTKYPGVTAAPSPAPKGAPPPPPDQVIGRTPSGNTILQRPDGTTYNRPPQIGDSYAGPEVTEPPGGRKALTCQLKCP